MWGGTGESFNLQVVVLASNYWLVNGYCNMMCKITVSIILNGIPYVFPVAPGGIIIQIQAIWIT